MFRRQKNYRNKKILVLDGEEAPYSLIVARALGSIGYVVDLGFTYGTRIFSAYSRYCRKYVFYPDPLFALDDFHDFLRKHAKQYDFIIPTMEKTQLATALIKDELEQKGVIIPVPPYHTLIKATNKATVLRLAIELGLHVPSTVIAKEPPNIDELVEKLGLPMIMKVSTEINIPPDPMRRYFVIRNRIDQRVFELMFERLARHDPVIIQKYVFGRGLGVSFIFRRGKLIAVFGHRRILERYKSGGPSVITETYIDKNALIQGMKILYALKWDGIAMVEFKLRRNGKVHFYRTQSQILGYITISHSIRK